MPLVVRQSEWSLMLQGCLKSLIKVYYLLLGIPLCWLLYKHFLGRHSFPPLSAAIAAIDYPFTALLSTKTVIGFWKEGQCSILFAIFHANFQCRLVWRSLSATDLTNFITLNVFCLQKQKINELLLILKDSSTTWKIIKAGLCRYLKDQPCVLFRYVLIAMDSLKL